ncbi:hypothetical protein V3C99_018266, partial [Haemonchus contortus]
MLFSGVTESICGFGGGGYFGRRVDIRQT